jgi:PST family polysaccharide transporter
VSPELSERKGRDGQVAKAIALTGLGKYAGQAVRWGATILIARLLDPSDYGLVGMNELFVGLVYLLAEFGVGTAVLKLRVDDPRGLARLNGLALLTGLIAFGIGLASAGPIAVFFKQPALRAIVMVSSISFVLTSLQTVPGAILQRDLRFKESAIIEFAGHILTALLVLAGALLGLRYWSLVIAAPIVNVIRVVWMWRLAPVGLAFPDLRPIREAAHYSAWVFAGRLGAYLLYTADFLVVGRVLGDVALGSYQFAWTLANTPNDQVNGLVARVSGSFYSALQHDLAEVNRLYRHLLMAVALVSVPMVLGLAAVAEDFVPVVLGPHWSSVIVPLQILCVFNALRIISILALPMLEMMGEAKFQTFIELAGLAYLPALFVAAALWKGSTGVALTWLVGFPPLLLLIVLRLRSRLGVHLTEIGRALLPAMASSMLMVAVVLGARHLIGDAVPVGVRLILLIVIGALSYVAMLLGPFRTDADRVLRVLKSFRR